MTDTPAAVLAALCAPHPVSRVLAPDWPPAAFATHGALARLPTTLGRPELSSIERLFAAYRGIVCFGNAKTGSRTLSVEQANPAMLFRMGLSLYLPDLVDCLPGLATMLRRLEQELGAPAGASRIGAFVAARDNGLTCHMDAEEVFSIQLVGEKRFHIAAAPDIESPWGMQFNPGDPCDEEFYPQAGDGFPDPARAQFETIDMRAGSVLFMPRGTWHRTEADSDSLSVSIIVRMPTALDWALAALRQRLLQHPRWRRPLYGAWGSGDAYTAAGALWRTLIGEGEALTEGLALEDALLTLVPESERLARAGARSRYQRRPEARLELRALPSGGLAASVVARDRHGNETRPLQLDVPPPMAATFRWLAERDAAFGADELIAGFPALPKDQHLRILDALVRGTYLKQLWFGRA